MLTTYAMLASLALAPPIPMPVCSTVAIEGVVNVERDKLVRLKAVGGPAGAAYDWDVTPTDKADVAERGEELLFAAPPGRYLVTLRCITTEAGKTKVTKCRLTVTIGTPELPKPIPIPTPKTDPKPDPKPDPVAATAILAVGSGRCTATPIWPRRDDGRWDVLTATHCVSRVGQACTLTMKDGRQLACKVSVMDRTADVCWLVTSAQHDTLPYAVLSAAKPAAGDKVWHNGYGTDKPGNREDGSVTGETRADGQVPLRISFSPGDSGGGVFRTDNGECIGVASSTSAFARVVFALAGGGMAAARLRPK